MVNHQEHEVSNGVVLIAFGGPSSSGKTTVARTIQSLIPQKTKLIHLDDFYLTDSKIPIDSKTGYQNWDCPEALDFKKFKKYLVGLKNGEEPISVESIQPKDTDLKLNEEESSQIRHVIDSNLKKFDNKKIVFVDGFMLFHDPSIIKLFDISLFFHATFDTLKTRRDARKGYNTAEGFWVDPPNYFKSIVWPAYEESHKHLFIDDDINKNLKPDLLKTYKIKELNNGESQNLFSLVTNALNFIIDNL
ncbi:NRK1 [Candida pseudojiufengensis]|uniref:NRK1 n=1 Tax=Candida pseudojiufengensis TaxID=497109 RepID=UPI0022243C66|nr:NRK1 [Candida pseudojiufengensis]KAI5962215.1 NRK1 [Candida pseudojiufengensis]